MQPPRIPRHGPAQHADRRGLRPMFRGPVAHSSQPGTNRAEPRAQGALPHDSVPRVTGAPHGCPSSAPGHPGSWSTPCPATQRARLGRVSASGLRLPHPCGSCNARKRKGAVMTDPRTAQTHPQTHGALLQQVSNALVALHKEQFGRGPTRAQSHFAGPDALLCVLEDALLPAEQRMVSMSEQQRVRESRMFLQVATSDEFVSSVEALTGRTVRAFASATDPDNGVVFETFMFNPDPRTDGRPAG